MTGASELSPAMLQLARESTDQRVYVTASSDVRIRVAYGHLVIEDGSGDKQRECRIPRVGSAIRKVVIPSSDGYISLQALMWAADAGIQIIQIDRQGQLIASGHEANRNAHLIRRQALSAEGMPNEYIGLSIVRHLLTAKLVGQAKLLCDFIGSDSSAVEDCIDRIADAQDASECRLAEGQAANTYFNAWSRVNLRWAKDEEYFIPGRWRSWQSRNSGLSGEKFDSTHPIHSLLNYAYSVAYGVARISCVGVGLDPRMGYIHADEDGRDSLAFDLLEVVRPEIDHYILSLINQRKFTHRDFYETRSGIVYLTAPLTHEICEQVERWQEKLNEAAAELVDILTGKKPRIIKRAKTRKVSPDYNLITTILPDDAWQEIEPELPVSTAKRGYVRISDRVIIAGILYRQAHGIAWEKMPARFGVSGDLMRLRLSEWRRSGTWERVCKRLSAAGYESATPEHNH